MAASERYEGRGEWRIAHSMRFLNWGSARSGLLTPACILAGNGPTMNNMPGGWVHMLTAQQYTTGKYPTE